MKIKQQCEDFFVKEINKLSFNKTGNYNYFLLEKKNFTTERAIEKICKILNIKRKNIGYAGNKDKIAVTQQYISIFNCKKNNNLNQNNIKLTFLGKGNERICLGDLQANYFEIVIRDLNNYNIKTPQKIFNYFGEQRFSKDNVEIGKAIIKKDFEKAINLLIKHTGDYEQKIKQYIKQNPNNYINALRLTPKKILQIFVHSYQSYLWNKVINTYNVSINKKNTNTHNVSIPILGFGTEFKDKKIEGIYNQLMEKEGITQRDFIIRSLPQLSSEGTERNMFAEIKDFKIINKSKDELNNKKYKIKVRFTLPKASYATEVIRQLI